MKSASEREIAIRTQDLRVSFGGKPILQGLNLSFPAGTLSVILGRSGSGKTTLLRSLNRLNELYPGSETSGVVELLAENGVRNVYDKGTRLEELRRSAGMVFQTPNVLPTSIFRNVALPLRLSLGLAKREIPHRVEEALEAAHLWDEVKDRLQDQASTLSGGQQQRLCLARVLALQPRVLLLDEPTASLDYRAAMKIEDLLLSLKEKYTIIAVSHSLRQARRLADMVIVIKEGLVARSFPASEFPDQSGLDDLIEEIF